MFTDTWRETMLSPRERFIPQHGFSTLLCAHSVLRQDRQGMEDFLWGVHATFSGHADARSAGFSGDGVLAASCDRTLKIWNTFTGECTPTFSGLILCSQRFFQAMDLQ